MAAEGDERTMVSEQIAPGMLPRVLNSFDMTIIFVAIVLFIVNASAALGAYVTFRSPWTPLFSVGHWRIWLGVLTGVSVLAAVLVYGISEYTRRRERPIATPTPAG
jgi:hypothetical protein